MILANVCNLSAMKQSIKKKYLEINATKQKCDELTATVFNFATYYVVPQCLWSDLYNEEQFFNTEGRERQYRESHRKLHSSLSPVFISADLVQFGYCFLCFSTKHSSNCFCSSFLVSDELYSCINAMALSALSFTTFSVEELFFVVKIRS